MQFGNAVVMMDVGLAIALMPPLSILKLAELPESRAGAVPIISWDYSPVPMDSPPEEQLELLLQRRRQHPQQTETIDAEIRGRFLETHAILILDMSGLTVTTQTQGIIPALEKIYHLRAIVAPILAEHGGHLLKAEADNIYGVFMDPDQAVIAAMDIQTQLQMADLGAGIGIGYGEVLAVGEHDLYGDQMNLASRLGEDLAEAGEILLTASARASLTDAPWPFESHQVSVQGGRLSFFKLVQP
jgi:class 3 adenylate cyclase